MKRVNSLKQVFKGLGLSSKNLVGNKKSIETTSEKNSCEEVDDELCAKILEAHGLAEDCSSNGTSMTSLDTLSNADSVPDSK